MATRSASAAEAILHDGTLQDHWLRRILAIAVDGSIIFFVLAMLSIAAYLLQALDPLGPYGSFGPYDFLVGRLWGLFFGLFAVAYFVLFEGSAGRTPGKAIFGLRVAPTAGPMGFSKALVRNISKIHWILLFLDLILGFFTTGDPRQRFTDRLAETTVSRTGQAGYAEEKFRYPQFSHTSAVPTQGSVAREEHAYCSRCGAPLTALAGGGKECPSCGATYP